MFDFVKRVIAAEAVKKFVGSTIRTALAALFGAAVFKGVDTGVIHSFIEATASLGVSVVGLVAVYLASLLEKSRR